MVNSILLIIAVGCLVIIAGVVLYDFVQKQQALNKLKISYNDCLLAVPNGQSVCEQYK